MKLTRFTITLGVAMAVAGCGKKENPEVSKAKVAIKQKAVEFKQMVKQKGAELLGPLGAPSNVQKQMDLCVATVSEIVDFGVDKAEAVSSNVDQEQFKKQLVTVAVESLSQIKTMIAKAKLFDNLKELVQLLVPELDRARRDPQFASVMPEVKSKEDVQAVADLVKLALEFGRQILVDNIQDDQKQPLPEFKDRVPLQRLTLNQDIVVLSDFKGNSIPPLLLGKGKKGTVKEVDDENDVKISFNDGSQQRVWQSNFKHIGVVQDIPSVWKPAVDEMREAMKTLGESVFGFVKSTKTFPKTQALMAELEKLYWVSALNQANQAMSPSPPSNVRLDVESVFLMLMIGVLAVVGSFRGRFVLLKDRLAEETYEFEAL